MNNKQQTNKIGNTDNSISAVEWLHIEFQKRFPKETYEMYNSNQLSYEDMIEEAKAMEEEQNKITEDTSDGYHTFRELYDFRMMYNAALFNEWGSFYYTKYQVHKSLRHHDGELCFGGGWFIVVAVLPTGQISNHYKVEHWDLFKIPDYDKALYPFDGHTPQDVLKRLKSL